MSNTIMDNTTLLSLKIAAVNANSIASTQKQADVHHFLAEMALDILLISETKLNSSHRINFAGYNTVRNDRNVTGARGGGTAILVKENINFSEVHYPNSKDKQILEYTIIQLITNNSDKLYIVSIYATNKVATKQVFLDELNNLFNKLKLYNHKYPYILAGD